MCYQLGGPLCLELVIISKPPLLSCPSQKVFYSENVLENVQENHSKGLL